MYTYVIQQFITYSLYIYVELMECLTISSVKKYEKAVIEHLNTIIASSDIANTSASVLESSNSILMQKFEYLPVKKIMHQIEGDRSYSINNEMVDDNKPCCSTNISHLQAERLFFHAIVSHRNNF